VVDNEVEGELQEEQEEASTGEKLNCTLQQCARSSSDAHIFTGHGRELRKIKAPIIDKSTECFYV
jgi:hypothetical protein